MEDLDKILERLWRMTAAPSALPKHKRKAKKELKQLIVELLEELSSEVIQPCEPECDPVRHALHQGSWQAHLVIEKKIKSLNEGKK